MTPFRDNELSPIETQSQGRYQMIRQGIRRRCCVKCIDEGLDISVHVLGTIKRRTSSSRRVEDTVTCVKHCYGCRRALPLGRDYGERSQR